MELQIIQNKIYELRGLRVMLDFDLALLYGVENRRLKEQVKRNIVRFPGDFMFQLTKLEWQQVIAICDNLPENENSLRLPLWLLPKRELQCYREFYGHHLQWRSILM
jgi:hypothetical protein